MKFFLTTIFIFLILFAGGWGYWRYNSEMLWVSPVPETIEKLPMAALQQQIQMCGWIPWWDEAKGLESVALAGDQLKVVSPLWYGLDSDGRLVERTGIKKDEMQELKLMHNWQLLPTINNEGVGSFDIERVKELLGDENLQQELISQLAMMPEWYDGWDLDWEEIEEADAEAYAEFVRKVAKVLHSQGKLLSVTVHPRTGSLGDWIGSRGHDWELLGSEADYVRIMAYDYHFSGSQPGSVTPLGWLNRVLQYAVKLIPMEKVVVGLPTYGYDWPAEPDAKGEGVTYLEAQRRLQIYGGEAVRDSHSGALQGKYSVGGVEHEIWFEDAESLAMKEKIVYAHGINRVCLWRLGGEDGRIWGGVE